MSPSPAAVLEPMESSIFAREDMTRRNTTSPAVTTKFPVFGPLEKTSTLDHLC